MIVAVEGPSAAGKTTWLRQSVPADHVVPEHGRVEIPADRLVDEATFWAELNSERWQAALAVEHSAGHAYCDGDPLKLHYHYCLMQIGMLPWRRFEADVEACRREISERRLGVADMIICEVPGPATLDERKHGDPTRQRSNFAVNRRLGPALHDWYGALEHLDPGRVRWTFPTTALDVRPRARFDLELYDAWMTSLPGRPNTAR